MRRGQADNLGEFGHETEAIFRDVEKGADVNGLTSLDLGQRQAKTN